MSNEVPACKWNRKAFTLETPREEAMENCKELESAAWYRDDVALLELGGGKDDHYEQVRGVDKEGRPQQNST